MRNINGDNFGVEDKYKIYRSVYDIIHPTISKKNISNYKVVLDDRLLPVHIFYPNKVSNISSCVIYIPGDGRVTGVYGKCGDICSRFAREVNKLVVAIDYFGTTLKYPTSINKVYRIVKHLISEFDKNGISSDKIYFVSDSVGGSILIQVILKLLEKEIDVLDSKILLLYPVIRNDYSDYEFSDLYLKLNDGIEVKVNYYLNGFYGKKKTDDLLNISFSNFPSCNFIVGDTDIFKDDVVLFNNRLKKFKCDTTLSSVKFASHGFLGSSDEDILEEAYNEIRKVIV